MNLADLVIKQIEGMGPTQAAAFFHVSVPTIYAWKKSGKPSIEAVQKMYDMQEVTPLPDNPTTDSQYSRPPENVTIPEEVSPVQEEETGDTPPTSVFSATFMKETNRRLDKLEAWVSQRSERIPMLSGTNPIGKIAPGMAVHDPATVLSDNRAPAPSRRGDWNTPKTEVQERKGWNAPVQETPGKNKKGNWNNPTEL